MAEYERYLLLLKKKKISNEESFQMRKEGKGLFDFLIKSVKAGDLTSRQKENAIFTMFSIVAEYYPAGREILYKFTVECSSSDDLIIRSTSTYFLCRLSLFFKDFENQFGSFFNLDASIDTIEKAIALGLSSNYDDSAKKLLGDLKRDEGSKR